MAHPISSAVDPSGAYAALYQRSIDDPEGFWAEQAARIDWFQPFSQVLDRSRPPFARWFVGGRTNLCHNAVDRHARQRPEAAALIWSSSEVDQEQVWSFAELLAEVQAMAASMQDAGVGEGDRVLIYCPMVPQAVFAMLACARIGAIHSVVFGGFAAGALAGRIDDCASEADRQLRRRQPGRQAHRVPAPARRSALRQASHRPERLLWIDRGLEPLHLQSPHDLAWASERERCWGRSRALRGAGVQRHQLHAVHQRHHRQAEGRAARCGRLRGRAGHQHGVDLRRPAGRELLLDLRHRLGGRPQLHRLRPADRRHGHGDGRGPADPPRPRESGGAWSRSTR